MIEIDKTKEIAPGMTVEEMQALYFNADALREPPYRLYQVNENGHRYYYRFENDCAVLYPSVTTLLAQTTPTSPFLIKWIGDNGTEGATEKRDLAAAYGTFMHAQFERLLINRAYDLDTLPEVLMEYMRPENLPDKFYYDSLGKIRKDLLAFAAFITEWNVRPLAVEISLVHPSAHYAGCIDLVCVMADPKDGKDFTAIVDFKSGRKGFFEDHELQLHLYRDMWVANYPDTFIERVYNFAPNDWRKAPTYKLKDQTASPNVAKIPYLLALAEIEDAKRDNIVTVIGGTLRLDGFSPEQNCRTISLAEVLKERRADLRPDSGALSAETDKPLFE